MTVGDHTFAFCKGSSRRPEGLTTQMPGEIRAQKQCKCSHTSTVELSLTPYNPAGPGGAGAEEQAGEESCPRKGMFQSRAGPGRRREGKSKPSRG